MRGIEDGRCTIPRAYCRACRNHPGERFPVDCPHGITKETAAAASTGQVTAIVRKKDCGTCPPVVVVKNGA